jgi:hypothetical protein
VKLKNAGRRGRLALAAAVAALGLAASAGIASAVTSSTSPVPHAAYACVNLSVHSSMTMLDSPSSSCPVGTTSIVVGAQGPAGTSAIVSVNALTSVSNWPERSGWANDTFTRDVIVTREGAAPAADCTSGAQQCWFYTASIGDAGTFTTVNGHASPNTTSATAIKGTWTGSMGGGGQLEFYANSPSPDPKLVPGTATGADKGARGGEETTTNWYEMFFPAGTVFGTAPSVTQTPFPSAPWTTYGWTYTAQVTCGTSSSITEKWFDGINPGDDGKGSLSAPPAGDGNITGANGCA